jgi:Tol biopolymer transport system component
VTFGSNANASPDSRFIVFDEGRFGSRDLRTIGIGGGASEVLIAHPADDFSPLWSPDGNYIIFKSNRHGGDALWGLAVKDGRAAGEPFLITDLAPGVGLLNWISQGVAFSKTININDIYIQSIDPQTNELVGKPRLLPYTPTGINSSPRWSPDGKNLAFAAVPLGRPWQSRIVVLPSGGGEAREFPIPIFRWYLITHALSWLPDGSGIGFATPHGNIESRQNTLLKLDIYSGEWKKWPLPGVGDNNWTPLEWGGDGKSFFYARQSFLQVDPGILKQELATGKEGYIYRLERGKGETVMNLRRSRDNKWLFIDLDKDSKLDESKSAAEVLAMELDTGKVQTIYKGVDDVGSLSLSPDGRTLLVLCDMDSNYGVAENLAIIPAGGGALKRLKIEMAWPKEDGFLHGFAAPDWSPDGKQIAFTTWSVKDETFLMKNVIPASKKK